MVKRIPKKAKTSISKIQRQIWELCKQITRNKYGNICYTCGRTGLESSNWHTGHVFPKAALSAYLKYDLRFLRPQCYNCNINLGGNGAVFIDKLREKEGQVYVSRMIEDRMITVKAYDHYVKVLEEYKKIHESN